MRRTTIIMAVLTVMLNACVPGVLTGDAATGAAPTGAGDAIATTMLNDPLKPAMVDAAEQPTPVEAVSAPGAGGPPATRPKPRPDTGAAVAADLPAPLASPVAQARKTPEQAKCEKSRGRWTSIGGGAGYICVRQTRDGGKSCDREGDCKGQCLARSRTCAPIDPLLGCNEVLQSDGGRVTLCLN